MEYLSPHKINLQAIYDYNPSVLHTETFSPNNFSGNQPSNGFGVPVPYGGPGNLEQWRIHTKQQLCQSMQIALQEIYDPSFGIPAGAGFTLSGLNLVLEVMRGWRPISGATSTGLQ
jgi:hypothetical protein